MDESRTYWLSPMSTIECFESLPRVGIGQGFLPAVTEAVREDRDPYNSGAEATAAHRVLRRD